MKESKNITRSALLTILSQFPAHILGILAGVFITRILGPEGRGEYAIFYANTTLFCTVFGFSIINSIIIFTANKKITEERLKTIAGVLLFLTVILSVVSLIIWINSKYKKLLFSDYNSSLLLIILFLTTIFITQLNAIFTAYFQGLRHFRIVNKVLILNGVYSCILFAFMYLLHRYEYVYFELVDIIFALVIILLMNTAHWFVYYFKHGAIKWNFKLNWKEDFFTFFKFAGLNHLSNILLFLNHRLILWIVAIYLDDWELGIFALGIGLANLLYLFSNPLTLVLESFLSSDKVEDKSILFSIFSRLQFTVILVVCIIVVSISPFILPLVYGKDFSHSVAIFNIIIIGIIMSCQSNIISSYFLINNKLKHNVIASIIGVSITVFFAPVFVQKYQLIGAASIQVLMYFGILLYLFITIRIKGGVSNNLFFATRSDIKFIRQQLQIVKKDKQTLT